MGLNDLIKSGSAFAVSQFAGTRTLKGVFASGDFTPGSTSALLFYASERPVTGNDLKVLPTTQHGENTKKLYSETQLYGIDETYEADQVVIDSLTWTVIRVKDVSGFGADSSFFKVFVARKVVGS